ncbi:MAG: phosphonopyruvate decarboxylase [Candidatus Amulumruptor caecigallinarius]|nr:phosphonopyruvate decarboxylase [Candidatus Amulumruptor caecigallinarius]MCM1397179.1 phosphonopyruvate decarboxylase [Candidatus Amulumruptor caecigallinarius]MCM1453132.1 phosphonopyruvate decarboxylase [bacterium]
MVDVEKFTQRLDPDGSTFFAGVPDSLLKSFCSCLSATVDPSRRITAANEGAAMGLAAGHWLATGRPAVVFMQNSGIGNAVNPLLSLVDDEVYRMPVLLIIGWRGEPGVHDEPQHVKQGKLTIPLLECMGIAHTILPDDTEGALAAVDAARDYMMRELRPYALVVRKGTFSDYAGPKAPAAEAPALELGREQAIGLMLDKLPADAVVVSTTGMISRELFELREKRGEGHARDFLTVGSMGHASQIAMAIALAQPQRPVYCFDGDGASIMHLGSLAIIGQAAPRNFVHIVFNNGAHDSVGGQPTAGFQIDLPAIAKACGYRSALSVDTLAEAEALDLTKVAEEAPALVEVKVRKGARKDLGRPTTTPVENKEALMAFLAGK